MIESFEFSIRALVEYNEIRAFLGDVLRIDRSQIVPESTFWDSAESSQGKFVGLEVCHSDLGFRTLCKWRQTWNLRDIELFQIASCVSVRFNSEVAIGNFIDLQDGSADQFIVITPAKQFYRAYAVTNTDVFETAPIDDELFDVEMLLKQEGTTKSNQP